MNLEVHNYHSNLSESSILFNNAMPCISHTLKNLKHGKRHTRGNLYEVHKTHVSDTLLLFLASGYFSSLDCAYITNA